MGKAKPMVAKTVQTFFIGIWMLLLAHLASICRSIVLSRLSVLRDPSFQLVEVNHNESKHRTESTEGRIVLKVHSPVFWIRLVFLNDIGFAQSYMLGEIECERLTDFFALLIKHTGNSASRTWTDKVADRVSNFLKKANDITQASLNANKHYSLSNDIFSAFLSRDMTYSCPIWNKDATNESLEDAQMRKLQNAITQAQIQRTDHVLEIGTGWGSFSILASRTTGCRVTTITLSNEQKKLAEQRIREAGLDDKIKVLLCDYRELPRTMVFDKVVSIEMIEHVGAAYLETYFRSVHRHLKPIGGIGVFQCITIPEARYESYKARQDFIQQYIFPGGHLPTVSHLVAAINKGSQGRMIVEEVQSVSAHYSRALESWKESFQQNFESKIKPALHTKYVKMTNVESEIFYRKWMYYFSYCSAGFRTKTLGDVIVTIAREGCTELHECHHEYI